MWPKHRDGALKTSNCRVPKEEGPRAPGPRWEAQRCFVCSPGIKAWRAGASPPGPRPRAPELGSAPAPGAGLTCSYHVPTSVSCPQGPPFRFALPLALPSPPLLRPGGPEPGAASGLHLLRYSSPAPLAPARPSPPPCTPARRAPTRFLSLPALPPGLAPRRALAPSPHPVARRPRPRIPRLRPPRPPRPRRYRIAVLQGRSALRPLRQ